MRGRPRPSGKCLATGGRGRDARASRYVIAGWGASQRKQAGGSGRVNATHVPGWGARGENVARGAPCCPLAARLRGVGGCARRRLTPASSRGVGPQEPPTPMSDWGRPQLQDPESCHGQPSTGRAYSRPRGSERTDPAPAPLPSVARHGGMTTHPHVPPGPQALSLEGWGSGELGRQCLDWPHQSLSPHGFLGPSPRRQGFASWVPGRLPPS